jgi:RNA polymerase sigma factor (sigma-70 family)
LTERELLTGITGADKKAFAQFYHIFKDRVFNVAFGYLRQIQDAEEITQDVFIEIHRSAKHFKGTSSVNTWVYKITVNKCLDKLRHQRAKKRFAFLAAAFRDDETSSLDIPDHTHHGLEADKKESLGILLFALDKLPVSQKTALILTQLELLKGKEVAEIMGVTPKAVEGLIQRGKINLKKELEKIFGNRGK